MKADPRFRDKVIARGKSFRGAALADVIEYLRSVPPAGAEEGEDDGIDHDLLRKVGYELVPKGRGERHQ
jgi:hypothetical protein